MILFTANLSQDIDEITTAVDKYLLEWKEVLRISYLEVTEDFYYWQLSLLDKKAFNLNKLIEDVTKAVEERATKIVQTSKNLLKFMYSKAKDKAEFLGMVQNNYRFNKAGVMAKTEVNTAANLGMSLAAEEVGAGKKTWITQRDEKVREQHVSLDGQTRDMDTVYSNGLQYPGDPSGQASEVVNCRCFQIFS